MPQAKSESFPLLDYLDALVNELRELAPLAVKGDVDAVHDARVATRRLKAAVDLMESVVSGKRRRALARIIRSLRKRLGDLRDLDVMLAQLPIIKSPRLAPAAQWMTKILTEQHDKALIEAAVKLPPSKVLARLGSWWGLRQEVLAARDAVPVLLAESIHLQVDAFADQAAKPAEPHLLRIAAKSLRYTLEMARAQKLPLSRSVLPFMKRIQEALGSWHDDVVLAERLMEESAEAMLAHHDADLQQGVLRLSATLLKRGKRQLARVEKIWQRDGNRIIELIRAAFPLTKAVEPEPEQSQPAHAAQPEPPALPFETV